MKRTSSSPHPAPSVARPFDPVPASTDALPAAPRGDEPVRTERQDALRRFDVSRLRDLLAERPDLPMPLELDPAAGVPTMHTLIDALPPHGRVPPISIQGPVHEGVDPGRLARLFTHPGLQELSLIDLQLSTLQMEAIAAAPQLHRSVLQTLRWVDDRECLMDPPFCRILQALPALRSLVIGCSAPDQAPDAEDDADWSELASFLLNCPLERLELDHCGELMPSLNRSWAGQHTPAWQSLTLSHMEIGHAEAVFLPALDAFLCRCIGVPALTELRLDHFFEDPYAHDPAIHGNDAIPPASYRWIGHMAQALKARQAPLQVGVTSEDPDALFIIMSALTGDPDALGGEISDAPAQQITCIRSLDMTFLADMSTGVEDLSREDPRACFLNGMTDWLCHFPRLDSLRMAMEPLEPPGAPFPWPEEVIRSLVAALDVRKLTSLEMTGTLLAPLPALLQHSQQRVTARSIHVALQTRALDVCFDFLSPPLKLPTDIGSTLVERVGPGSPSRHLVSTLPRLDRQHLVGFVDRYNQLAGAAGSEEHPLTDLAREVRQRRWPAEPPDQADAAADLR